jgi:hypothetical protein
MLTHDRTAWNEGKAAGEAGKTRCPYPQGTPQAWSWHSGHVEGDAKRLADWIREYNAQRLSSGRGRTQC